MIPIGDTPNPPGFRAWVNWLLIAANVLVYVLLTFPLSSTAADLNDPAAREYVQIIAHGLPPGTPTDLVLGRLSGWDVFVFGHGFKPGAPSVVDLFSSMFMHAGFGHLAGNMLFLWIYGDNVEHRLGRPAYLLTYLGTGAVATLAFGLVAGGSMVPLVGASGAISGVLGIYFLLFKRNKVRLLVMFFPFFVRVLLVPARLVLGFFVVIDNILPLLVSPGTSGVAYGAHLGGFAAGLGVAALVSLRGWQARGTPAEPRGRLVADAEYIALRRARKAARSEAELARIELALGDYWAGLGHPTTAYQHFAAVLDLDAEPAVQASARQQMWRIDQAQGRGRVH